MPKRFGLSVGHFALVLVSVVLLSTFILLTCLEAVGTEARLAAEAAGGESGERLQALADRVQFAVTACVLVCGAIVVSIHLVMNSFIRDRLHQLKAAIAATEQPGLRNAQLNEAAQGNDEFGEIGRELLKYNQRVTHLLTAKTREREVAPGGRSAEGPRATSKPAVLSASILARS